MKLLCGHQSSKIKSLLKKQECTECQSFYDLVAVHSNFKYDASYPELRGHNNQSIGELKIKTLKHWLNITSCNISNLNVCEVGFGAGYTLHYIRTHAKNTYGVEAIAENIQNAVTLGVPAQNIFSAYNLPTKLPVSIDLWIYQDSFEHIPDPNEHLKWVASNSSESAFVLLVLPEAGSTSEKVMGTTWPHRTMDHIFHFSRKGLQNIFKRHGFILENSFYPSKYLGMYTIFFHLFHKFGLKITPPEFMQNKYLRFNLGEQGLLFKKGLTK